MLYLQIACITHELLWEPLTFSLVPFTYHDRDFHGVSSWTFEQGAIMVQLRKHGTKSVVSIVWLRWPSVLTCG